jgi:RNA-binding protein 26
VQFVDDVFVALATKAFRSVNSTLAGGLSVHIPPPPRGDSPPGGDTIMSSPRDSRRAPKRSYYDRDEPERDDNDRYRSSYPRDRDRGSKMPRRGGGIPRGSWTGRGGFDGGSGRGAAAAPLGATVPPGQPPALFGVPPMPPVPWMPPNPNDPMSAFLAAQAAAAWGFHPPGAKLGDQKKIVKKVGERCKDYDEKGFCMKGDMCPYEHGVDPIVVSGQESKAEGGFGSHVPFLNSRLIGATEYDPNNSMIFPPASTPERSTRGGRGTYRGRGSRSGSYGMRSNRAEFSITGPSFDRSNPRLVVENIPEDKLTESAIKDFFSTFGTIDKVEIHQHKHLAILTFTSWEMAKAAYDSPAPIFDNRFVKVFWFKSSEDTEAAPTAPQTVEEEKIDIEEIKRKQEELQKAYEQKMAKKKAHEEAVKELQKRQEELKRLQAEEKKKLMEKLAKKHAAAAAVTAASSPAASGSASPATSGTISAKQSDKAKVDATTVALKAQLEALQAEAEALGIDQNATEDSFDVDGFRGMGYRGRGRGRGRFPTRGYPPSYRGYSTYRGRGTWAPRGGAAPIPTLRLDNRTKRVAVTVPGGDKEEEIRHYLLVGFSFNPWSKRC